MTQNYKPQGLQKQKASYRERKVWRPASYGKLADNCQCPYCNGDVKASYVICPHCGRSLTPDKCSFCGEQTKPEAKFCTKCGQPKEGLLCPECGTLNSRNFCRKCGAPLTPMGQAALAEAKNDPAFQAVEAKAKELAELHARIVELQNQQPKAELSDADKALLDEYADVLSSIGAYKPQEKPKRHLVPDAQTRPHYEEKALSLDEIMEAYRQKADEMNQAMAAMVPPPDFTPEQQRDYYTARKVATLESEYSIDWNGYNPSQWKCNYCGYLHPNPSDCAEPQLGGVWIYQTPEEYATENRVLTHQSLKIQ